MSNSVAQGAAGPRCKRQGHADGALNMRFRPAPNSSPSWLATAAPLVFDVAGATAFRATLFVAERIRGDQGHGIGDHIGIVDPAYHLGDVWR